MTMQCYSHRDRRSIRARLYIFRRRVNALLALLVLLAVLLPSQALAARTCPAGYPLRIAHGCARVDRHGVACDRGYQGQFSWTSDGDLIGKCVPGPLVRRGQP